MIVSRRVILAKIEATQGVDALPVPATDAVRVENPQFAWSDPRIFEPNSAKPSFGAEQSLYGGALGQLTFDVILKGSGAAGTAPEIGPLLRACGLDETLVVSTSATYAPVSTGQESASIHFHKDGKLYKLLGALGDAEFVAEVGQPCKVSFTFTGHVVGPTDIALPAQTLNATVPPVFLGAAFTSDAFAAKISSLSFGLGNEIAKPADVSAADGFGDLRFTDRAVAGSFDPEETLIANYDWEAKWQANTLVNLTTGVVGSVAGNRWQATMAKAQYREIGEGDRDKISIFELGFTAVENAGDDELSLVFT